jgi:hypothetical protein
MTSVLESIFGKVDENPQNIEMWLSTGYPQGENVC